MKFEQSILLINCINFATHYQKIHLYCQMISNSFVPSCIIVFTWMFQVPIESKRELYISDTTKSMDQFEPITNIDGEVHHPHARR
jgi:hypothetical protein